MADYETGYETGSSVSMKEGGPTATPSGPVA